MGLGSEEDRGKRKRIRARLLGVGILYGKPHPSDKAVEVGQFKKRYGGTNTRSKSTNQSLGKFYFDRHAFKSNALFPSLHERGLRV